MERRLHPLFQQSLQNNSKTPDQKIQIQEKFDPTPAKYGHSSQASHSADITEFLNESKLKINRLTQKLANFEDRLDGLTQEVRTANSRLSSRFNERGLAEHKIEALIERQNSVINSFEKRMNQMTKNLEDSQLQLIRTQSALEDARREIAKLKRL
jgi:chromosome segregation ATPase